MDHDPAPPVCFCDYNLLVNIITSQDIVSDMSDFGSEDAPKKEFSMNSAS
jgi:hypothetical protein